MKKYGAVITAMIILSMFILSASLFKSDYEMKTVVIDLPAYDYMEAYHVD